MSDSESQVAPDAASQRRSAPQNEACTNCRAVKRRCLNEGKGTVCTRCAKMNLGDTCVYHQQKRGRKSGSGSGPRKRRPGEVGSTSPSAGEPSASVTGGTANGTVPMQRPGAAATGVAAGSGDWLADLLRTQAESSASAGSGYTPIASTSSARFPNAPQPPIAPAPAAYPPFTSVATMGSMHGVHVPPAPRPPGPVGQPSGPSPAASYQSAQSGATVGASPSAPQATPATGGFSLVKLLKENQPNGGGSEAEPPRHSLADAFAPGMANEGPRRPEKVFEDIVVAGIIPEEQVEGLFQFYFAHLNPMTSLLDPDLHTVEFCRSRSAFLFTAILTVASKVAHPTLYPPSLKYAKSLLGQAFEAGTNTLELVQALATLVFWQDPTDDSGARKLAYAIRCAYELNIHKRGKRPLPDDEMALRKALNPERTWYYLTIADHRFSTQRGLPKMINNDFRSDAIPWLLEHKSEQLCPQSAGLAPLIELGRVLDTFAVLIAPEDGLPSVELLRCLERDVEAWRSNWSLERASLPLQPAQASLVRFYGTVLQFQLLEINLYLAIRRTTNSLDSFGFDPRTDARSSPLVVFSNCIKSAIKVLDVMERELRFMVYSFDSMWVGAASASIWLAQNLSGMEAPDRHASLAALTRLQTACSDISNGPQSMAAYTSRLLQHLLIKVQVAESTAAAAAASANQQAPEASSSGATASGLPAVPAAAGNPLGATPSYVKASLSAPSWSTDPGSSGTAANGYSVFNSGGFSGGTFTPPQPPQIGVGQRVQAQQPMWDDNGGRGAGGAPNADTMAAAASGADQGFDALNANFLASMMPPMQSFDEDLPFPAGDDAFWQSLFPLSFEAP